MEPWASFDANGLSEVAANADPIAGTADRTSVDSGAAEPVVDTGFGSGAGTGDSNGDRDGFGPDAGTGDGDGDRDGFGPGASDGDGGENALAPRQTTPYSLVMYVSNTQSIKYRNCSFRIVGYYL